VTTPRQIPTARELEEGQSVRQGLLGRFRSAVTRIRVRPGVGEARAILTDRPISNPGSPSPSDAAQHNQPAPPLPLASNWQGLATTTLRPPDPLSTAPVPTARPIITAPHQPGKTAPPTPPQVSPRFWPAPAGAPSPAPAPITAVPGPPQRPITGTPSSAPRPVSIPMSVRLNRGAYYGPTEASLARAHRSFNVGDGAESEGRDTGGPLVPAQATGAPAMVGYSPANWVGPSATAVSAVAGPLPVQLSCNARGEVWLTGPDRRGLSGRSAELDRIVRLVLQRLPDGGRFTVTAEGVRVDRTGAWILRR
jgi:hypothetical protein